MEFLDCFRTQSTALTDMMSMFGCGHVVHDWLIRGIRFWRQHTHLDREGSLLPYPPPPLHPRFRCTQRLSSPLICVVVDYHQ